MSDLTKKLWYQTNNLLYRLHNNTNYDEIRITMVNGDQYDKELLAAETAKLKNVLESYNNLLEENKRLRRLLEDNAKEAVEVFDILESKNNQPEQSQ
jgi:hypothetical protein